MRRARRNGSASPGRSMTGRRSRSRPGSGVRHAPAAAHPDRADERRCRHRLRSGRASGIGILSAARCATRPGAELTGMGMDQGKEPQGPLAGIKVVELGTAHRRPLAGQIAGGVRRRGHQDRAARRSAIRCASGASCTTAPRCGGTCRRATRSRSRADLKTPRARRSCGGSPASADIVIENFRPGALEKWGLGWEALSATNPRLVMVRISGYGQTGPYRERPGLRRRSARRWAASATLTGSPDRPPVARRHLHRRFAGGAATASSAR